MKLHNIHGRIWVFGDNIDTDLIFPLEHFFSGKNGITDPDEIRKHAMEGIDPDFAKKVTPGDIVVVGENFGCGSHREQAVTCFKLIGVSLIIGKSFGRIYYRNAVNLGLPLAEWDETEVEGLEEGDELAVDLIEGLADNLTRPQRLRLKPMAPLASRIVSSGGLVPTVQAWGLEDWWKA